MNCRKRGPEEKGVRTFSWITSQAMICCVAISSGALILLRFSLTAENVSESVLATILLTTQRDVEHDAVEHLELSKQQGHRDFADMRPHPREVLTPE
jgi:hypothetical protein